MPNPIRNIVLTLALSGCSTMVAHGARDKLVAMEAPDLVACAGWPDIAKQIRSDALVAEWKSATISSSKASSGFSMSLPLGTSVTISPPAESCHMQATILRDGTVVGIDLSSTTGVYDDDGSCAQLVAECIYHPDSTGKEAGYDVFKYLLGAGK